jgi:hypothetical protein
VYLKNQARSKHVEMADDGVTAKPSKADVSPNAHSVSAFKNGGSKPGPRTGPYCHCTGPSHFDEV